jgi:hypothetical protein
MAKAKTKTKPRDKELFVEVVDSKAVPEPQKERKAEPPPPATANAVAIREPEPPSLIAVIARAASDKRVDVAKMKELLAMQQAIEGRDAEREFNRALLLAQSEIPKIVKDRENTSTHSQYATLEKVSTQVDHIARKHGFTMSFGTDDSPLAGHYRIVCDLAHSGGHTRRYQCDLQGDVLGPKGNPTQKTPIQGTGSTMSYGRRYLKVMMFDLVIVGEDKDGNRAKPEDPPLTMEQAQRIRDYAEACACSIETLLKFLNKPEVRKGYPQVEAVTDLPGSRFDEAIEGLRRYDVAKKDRAGKPQPEQQGGQS